MTKRGSNGDLESQAGFTLFELLVATAIIGLLLSLIMVGFGYSQAKARDSRRISDMRQAKTGLELYYSTAQGYPDESVWAVAVAATGNVSCGDVSAFNVPRERKPGFAYEYSTFGGSVWGFNCGAPVWTSYKIRFQTEHETELGPAGHYYISPKGFTTCDPFLCG